MELPNDPFILLSYINTKLRDDYGSISDLCEGLDLDCQELTAKLASAGFEYIPEINQFR